MQGMEVINDPNVQAVWVCSPSQFHADQIKAAAKAGKHIFCEKPIATDLKGTIEAVQARVVVDCVRDIVLSTTQGTRFRG